MAINNGFNIDFKGGFRKIDFVKKKKPVPISGNNAVDESKEELSALLTGFKNRSKQEQDRFKSATDSEYWFCVCFKNREDKELFLKKYGIFNHGDKYVDGYFMDKQLTKRSEV